MTLPDPPVLSEHGIAYDLAARLLTVVNDGFTAAGVTLPERQYVGPGVIVAYDCEQLTVVCTAIGSGVPGRRANLPIAGCREQRLGSYRIELVRCVPVIDDSGNPPPPAALQASAQATLRDLDLLESTVRAALTAVTGGDPVFISAAAPVTAEGGLVASLLDVDVPLSWYTDAAP